MVSLGTLILGCCRLLTLGCHEREREKRGERRERREERGERREREKKIYGEIWLRSRRRMERDFNCINIKTGRQTERGKRGEKRDERGG